MKNFDVINFLEDTVSCLWDILFKRNNFVKVSDESRQFLNIFDGAVSLGPWSSTRWSGVLRCLWVGRWTTWNGSEACTRRSLSFSLHASGLIWFDFVSIFAPPKVEYRFLFFYSNAYLFIIFIRFFSFRLKKREKWTAWGRYLS